MRMPHTVQRIVAGAMVAGSITAAGYAMAAGSAQAESRSPPQYHGPLHGGGPYRWCPGDSRTGGPGMPFFTNPPNWDWNVCHSYYIVQAEKATSRRVSGKEIIRPPRRPDPLPLGLPSRNGFQANGKPS